MGSVSCNFILGFFFDLSRGDRMIKSQARTNIQERISETENILDTQHNSPHIKRRSSSPPLPPLPVSVYSRSSEPEYKSTNEHPIGVDLEGLIQSGNLTLEVIGLRKYYNPSLSSLNLRLRGDATLDEINVAIKDAGASLMILQCFLSTSEASDLGFEPPSSLSEEPELRISVTEGDSVYDATTPGGLKVNR
jgi:hypothetical protein